MVNVTATSVELTGLRPESTYTISVRAYTAAGPGEDRRLTVACSYYQHQSVARQENYCARYLHEYACTVLYNCAGDISVHLECDCERFSGMAVMSCEESDLDHTCATSESKPEWLINLCCICKLCMLTQLSTYLATKSGYIP